MNFKHIEKHVKSYRYTDTDADPDINISKKGSQITISCSFVLLKSNMLVFTFIIGNFSLYVCNSI